MASRRIKYFKIKFPSMCKAFTLKTQTLVKVLKEPRGKHPIPMGSKTEGLREHYSPK